MPRLDTPRGLYIGESLASRSYTLPPNPWLPTLEEPYVDVFVDGACSCNRRGEPKAVIGIWFGPGHPLNVSRPAHGRQTNNAAEIEATVEAAIRAQGSGIKTKN